MLKNGTISTENVMPGHPDKICDRISDGILDLFLEKDENSRCAIECFATTNNLIIGGEVSSSVKISTEEVNECAKNIIRDFGETRNFEVNNIKITNLIHSQSVDIAQGVAREKEIGAGDQGMMFGYACDDNEFFIPNPILKTRNILQNIYNKIKDKSVVGLGPDGKAQISYNMKDGKADEINNVVVSMQHTENMTTKDVMDILIPIIDQETKNETRSSDFQYHINATGRFVTGGPDGDVGLTGRKIIADSYGGFAGHGGGAFSGKDATKVDRSGAYIARAVAKNIVAQGLAKEVLIQISYCIGIAEPVGLAVNTFGTGKMSDQEIEKLIRQKFDLTPKGIINLLNLKKVKYYPTSFFGHFGRKYTDSLFTWENENLVKLV